MPSVPGSSRQHILDTMTTHRWRRIPVHVNTSTGDFDSMRRNFARFAELRVSIYITELDVMTDWEADPDAEAERQANVYENVTSICVEQPACMALQTWGLSDRYAWRGVFDGLALDEDFRPKPAWRAMQRVLARTPPTPRHR